MACAASDPPGDRPLRVLISAYACEPGRGSEPGIGWNMACALAERHDVWVITRASNLAAIREGTRCARPPRLRVHGFDLPAWARWWKRGQRGVQLYYYVWQIGAYGLARDLHSRIGFDIAHHVTFGKYWMPSFMYRLPIPFVWGPVGGGESAPRSLQIGSGVRGWLYEAGRAAGRWVGEHDPFLRATARRCSLALATTSETASRLRALGARAVLEMSPAALSDEELDRLRTYPIRRDGAVRFLSVGRLLHWKGVHLALRAFAKAGLSRSEYWIVGGGPEQGRLQQLSSSLGIAERVRFWGEIPRNAVLEILRECDVLVHPSLHDSSGWACLEAMAAGRPVICLDLGGPGLQVTAETGIKVSERSSLDAVAGLALAMTTLTIDGDSRERLGLAARERVAQEFTWSRRGEQVSRLYRDFVE